MNQCDKILNHIKRYGSITQAEAVHFYGCYRLGARIADLKKQGVPIVSNRETALNRDNTPVTYARYSLGGDVPCRTE